MTALAITFVILGSLLGGIALGVAFVFAMFIYYWRR